MNAVTGKAVGGSRYATATVAHSETVLRGFYDFRLEAGTGPMVNPFPLTRHRGAGRAHAHHNPIEPFARQRSGRYRPKVVDRAPRCIPDERFDELFAQLGSHRDRALVAFWVSTGARASELLGATVADVDPGQQLITVIRKGTRAMQPLPAAADAFVWLRLYQVQLAGMAPSGRDQPLWWTLREPLRPFRYDAARAMFNRANAVLAANWTLHDLRHTAAYRMARDPQMRLTDVQWVLGHAHLSTTQRYLNPVTEDVIAELLAYHARRPQRRRIAPRACGSSSVRPGRDRRRHVAGGPDAGGGIGEIHRRATGRGLSAAAGRRGVAGHRGAPLRGGRPGAGGAVRAGQPAQPTQPAIGSAGGAGLAA
ncbi:tyrosine-type recombinase/integrase [Mycobacterium sp.]|uniref:tyrosine-type recombinase/integrase n=1 Tax=Mycobacterium sp. TaxID=1785 RepID=UPI003F94BDFC